MANSQNKEKFEDYEGFVEKFKPKLTTDDCYTPPLVYDAVADYVAAEYGLDRACFCRPFYPGGDFESFDYSGKIVLDNPPFSILMNILKFYVKNNIRFFLFAPTLVGLVRYSDICTALAVGADITYDNGATITTSFVTNLEDPGIRMKTAPGLYRAASKANEQNRREIKKQQAKYSYPPELITSAAIYPLSQWGVEFSIPRDKAVRVEALDAQREKGKTIFGHGLLVAESVRAERERAERERAERERAELWKLWELSERERKIIEELEAGG